MTPEELEKLKELEKMKDVLGEVNKLEEARSMSSDSITEKTKDSTSATKETSDALSVYLEKLKKMRGEAEKFDLTKFSEGAKNLSANMGKIMSDAGTSMLRSIGQTMSSINEVTEDGSTNIASILNAGIPLGLAVMQKKAVETMNEVIPYFEKMENAIKPAQKQIMQMTIPFTDLRDAAKDAGGGFAAAQENVASFNNFLAKSIRTTRNTQEVIMGVSKALGKTFGPDATRPLEGLINVHNKLNSEMTQTNAALLIATATGADHSQIVSMMESAYLDLGSKIENTIGMFGQIYEAATKSGIGFERTAQSIMRSAQTLKFWGGTIDSITPLFNTFSKSLTGIGRQGLTPELLQSFVGGLNQMTFSTRALLSMQMPSARGGGLLTGGLKMEAALEGGTEGMRDVVSSLTSTLKKFGGPRILTREQAIESPALTRNYMIQRQLLGQMMNISDVGKQNQMMRILQDIDKGGSGASATNANAIGELLKAGEDIGNETVTAIDEATQILEAAIVNQGATIRESIQNMSRESGMSLMITGLKDIVADAATGNMSAGEIVGRIMKQMADAPKTDISALSKTARIEEKKTGAIKKSEREKESALSQVESELAIYTPLMQIGQKIADVMRETATPEQKETFEKHGVVPSEITDLAKASSAFDIKGQIAELKKEGVSKGEERHISSLRKSLDNLNKGLDAAEKMFVGMGKKERIKILQQPTKTEKGPIEQKLAPETRRELKLEQKPAPEVRRELKLEQKPAPEVRRELKLEQKPAPEVRRELKLEQKPVPETKLVLPIFERDQRPDLKTERIAQRTEQVKAIVELEMKTKELTIPIKLEVEGSTITVGVSEEEKNKIIELAVSKGAIKAVNDIRTIATESGMA